MSGMYEINIEDIMNEIRMEIKQKGYTNDILSFNDVIVDNTEINTDKFDKVLFNEELYTMNSCWNVQTYHPIVTEGNIKTRITGFIKRLIRKCIKFYVEPITMDQDTFNATVTRSFNLLNCYISENSFSHNDKRSKEDDEIIHSILKQNRELTDLVKQLIDKQEELTEEIEKIKKCD